MSSQNPYVLGIGGKLDPLTDIRNMGIITAGDVYWVSSVSDSRHRTRTNLLGQKIVKTSLQSAIDSTRDDQNDYILVVPSDANAVFGAGTAIDLNKDRVHVLGLGYNKAKRSYTATFRSSMGTVPDTEVLAVTGDGCEWAGLRVLGTLGTNAGGTMTNGVAFISAHDFWAHDAVFEDSTNAWGTPPVLRGAGTAANDARFDEVSFAISGTGNVESAGNAGLVTLGDGNKRWQFNDCSFSLPAGSVTETMVFAGTGVKEVTHFKRCTFRLSNGTAFAVTSAVRGSVTANNPIIMDNCSYVSFTQAGTDPNVFKTPVQGGTRAVAYDQGLSVGTAMLVAA